jgi:carbamoyl-phosphate synthase large subunit
LWAVFYAKDCDTMMRVTRPLNALVLGVGGNVSQSILKALDLAPTPTRVVAACINTTSMGLYTTDRAYLSPLARDVSFLPWLLEVCQHEEIDIVMSGSEIVLDVLAEHAHAVHEQTGARCVVSSSEVLQTGWDKLLTCEWLEARGMPVPPYAPMGDVNAVRKLVAEHDFPLVAKPRFGKGSDGVLVLRDQADLDRVVFTEELSLRDALERRVEASDLLLQKYIGSVEEEYTVGAFCDDRGRLKGTIALRRRLLTGTTIAAELGDFPEVRRLAGDVVEALGPVGPCNVQLRLHEGKPVPFEINPRFSGTTAIRARLGFNEVDAALRHFALGEPAPSLKADGTTIVLRYWTEIYISQNAEADLQSSGQLETPRSAILAMEDWPRR